MAPYSFNNSHQSTLKVALFDYGPIGKAKEERYHGDCGTEEQDFRQLLDNVNEIGKGGQCLTIYRDRCLVYREMVSGEASK
ncbi:MAG: hypothetical protein M0Q13_08725 [Methanothrix sp.]|nr:hypothetical protein [Methanothrix sp.]